MNRLTKRAVDALRPPITGQAFLWDGELRFGSGARKAGVAVGFADLQPLITLTHQSPDTKGQKNE